MLTLSQTYNFFKLALSLKETISNLYNNNKTSILFYSKNIVLVCFWGLISLWSSYNLSLIQFCLDIPSFQTTLVDKVLPLILWMGAFFLDYIISVNRPPLGYSFNFKNIKAAQWVLFLYLMFLAGLIARHDHHISCEICFWGIFATMVTFKWLSLNLFCKIEEMQ